MKSGDREEKRERMALSAGVVGKRSRVRSGH